MKVITAQEMGRIEKHAYADGASDADFMEAAGRGTSEVVRAYIADNEVDWRITLLCGKGNNAGDAYVVGYYLKREGYEVRALQLAPLSESTLLCQENCRRFQEAGGEVIEVGVAEEIELYPDGVIVDGIVGTGFHGEVTGLYASAIHAANEAHHPIIAIDIPSGVNGSTGVVEGVAIQAAATVYLGLPKTGFFLAEGWNHVGALTQVSFGLSNQYIKEATPDLMMLTDGQARQKLPRIIRNRHKYQAGYVVALAGSPTMAGAAVLSSYSTLRAGAGICRLLHTPDMEMRLSSAPAELLLERYQPGDSQTVLTHLNQGKAALIGPGLGQSEETHALLQEVLPKLEVPVVIDADGLNFLASSGNWTLPTHAVLTPHVGEMKRLLGIPKEEKVGGMEWIERCHDFAIEKGVTLVLKGGPSYTFSPMKELTPWVIPHGHPGMATAGCGDVLTGVIAAFLAQGLQTDEAARLGVAVHAIAGECAAERLTAYGMVAGDIADHLPDAFHALMRTTPHL